MKVSYHIKISLKVRLCNNDDNSNNDDRDSGVDDIGSSGDDVNADSGCWQIGSGVCRGYVDNILAMLVVMMVLIVTMLVMMVDDMC